MLHLVAMTCLPEALLVLLLLLRFRSGVAQQVQPRIVGGQTTTLEAAGGFVVNVRNNGKMLCGGSLHTPIYVISAAHCVYRTATSRLTVQGGVTKLNQVGIVRRVVSYNIPSAYTPSQMNMDIAVLRLESALTGSGITTIPLCSVQWRAGDYMRVSGWGVTRYGNSNPSMQLRTVRLQLIRKDVCIRMYAGLMSVPSAAFCSYSQGKDTCSGDSGSGAINDRNELCGVVSSGRGCANSRYPGIYTSVPAARSFLTSVMGS